MSASSSTLVDEDAGISAPAGPPEANYVVHYAIFARPEIMRGTFSLRIRAERTAEGKWSAPVRLWHIRAVFPFEGAFCFRGMHIPKGKSESEHVWVDLQGPDAVVPRTGPRELQIKATPLWDVYNSKHDSVPRLDSEFPFEPAEWELQAPSRIPACTSRGAISAADLDTLEFDVEQDVPSPSLFGGLFGGGSSSRNGVAVAVTAGQGVASAAAASGAGGEGSTSGRGVGVVSLARRAGRNMGAGFAGLLRRAGAAAAELIEGGAPPSEAAAANMMSAQTDLRTPFRAGDSSHEEALGALWRGLFPDEGECRRPDGLWVEAGCMGPDPADTFAAGGPTRAAGVLGLQTLVYCATKHGGWMRELLTYNSGEDDTCLRVVGTVNALVVDLAGRVGITADDVGSKRAAYFRLLEDTDAFSELVFLALVALSGAWTELGGTQARFADVLELATERAMSWLATGPTSVDALRLAAKGLDGVVAE